MERESPKECVNFLSYAKGSCGELRTQIYIGIDIGYISEEIGKHWIKESREISDTFVVLLILCSFYFLFRAGMVVTVYITGNVLSKIHGTSAISFFFAKNHVGQVRRESTYYMYTLVRI